MNTATMPEFDYSQHRFVMRLVEDVLNEPNEQLEFYRATHKRSTMLNTPMTWTQSVPMAIKKTQNPLAVPNFPNDSATKKPVRPKPMPTTKRGLIDVSYVLRKQYGPNWSTIESDELLHPNQKHYVPTHGRSLSLAMPSVTSLPSPPSQFRSIQKTLPNAYQVLVNGVDNTNNRMAHQMLAAPEQSDCENATCAATAVKPLQYARRITGSIQQRQLIPTTIENNTIAKQSDKCNGDTYATLDGNYMANDCGVKQRFFEDPSVGQPQSQYQLQSNYVPLNKYTSDMFLPFCSFCKKNNKPYEVYTSHVLKMDGKNTCPVLRECICACCGYRGHTAGHCLKNPNNMAKLLHSSNYSCAGSPTTTVSIAPAPYFYQ